MRHTMTVTALTAALLVSTAAYANDASMKSSATIDSLPDKGTVSLSGTVDRVVDGDTFILRDSTGDKIDVHTASATKVKVGDSVTVKGEKGADIAGMGEEIKGASLTVGSKISTTASHTKDKLANALDRTGEKIERNVDEMTNAKADADAKAMAKVGDTEKPYAARDNTEAKKTAAYDMDVDVKADADVAKVAGAGKMTAKEASNIDAAHAKAGVTASVNDTIAALPKEGAVELNGVVDRISNNNTFILRDAAGKTIDVHTASNVDVQPGDTVSVNGNVKSELLGFGRQIEGAKVLVVSAAE